MHPYALGVYTLYNPFNTQLVIRTNMFVCNYFREILRTKTQSFCYKQLKFEAIDGRTRCSLGHVWSHGIHVYIKRRQNASSWALNKI